MEQDLDNVAKALLVQKRIAAMLEIVEQAKNIRKTLPDEQRELLSEPSGRDEMAVAFGLAKVSDSFLMEFETSLYEIAEMASQAATEVLEPQAVALAEGFIVMLSELKPRSRRHLENFFSAATDGEWVEGLFIAKGKDSEFRCIDRCSDDAKAEFGLAIKK